MVRTKVFVGNLSFATKENELAKEFEASGKVISANIITRGPRSLGYGFVEMDNEQDAENAVKLLNKKEIDGRPINVEVAKPREEGADDQQNNNNNNRAPSDGSRGRGRGGRGGPRGGFRGSRGGFRGSRGGFGGPRGGFRQDEGEENTQNNNNQNDNGEGRRGGRGGRGRGRGGRGRGRGGNGDREQRPRREERERREDTRAPSATTLFVANLPFTLEDDGFSKILKDASLAYKSAHVVKKRSGRSKGFGFVEFENEGDQQKALNALNTKQVEGRELVVKVALTENKPEGETAEKKTEEKPTTAPTTTTTENKTAEVKPSPKTEKK